MSRFAVSLTLVAMLAGCGGGGNGAPPQAQPPQPVAVNMDRVLDDFIANNGNVRSLAMLAVKNGQVVYRHKVLAGQRGRK